jgi:hypothetical protein
LSGRAFHKVKLICEKHCRPGQAFVVRKCAVKTTKSPSQITRLSGRG